MAKSFTAKIREIRQILDELESSYKKEVYLNEWVKKCPACKGPFKNRNSLASHFSQLKRANDPKHLAYKGTVTQRK